jgi:uncharacterized membrane protein
MEPQWTKQISSEVVCNFFYIFFVIYAVIAVLSIVAMLGLFGMAKKMSGYALASGGIGYFIAMALAATQALFFYLICDRAIIKKAVEKFVSN